MADKIKLLLAAMLVAAGIGGFYYYADEPLLYRVLGLLAVMGVALAVASQTRLGANAIGFGREAYVEMRKVVWPTRRETTQTTLVVLLMVIIVGLILWLFDMFLLWAMKLLTGQGG